MSSPKSKWASLINKLNFLSAYDVLKLKRKKQVYEQDIEKLYFIEISKLKLRIVTWLFLVTCELDLWSKSLAASIDSTSKWWRSLQDRARSSLKSKNSSLKSSLKCAKLWGLESTRVSSHRLESYMLWFKPYFKVYIGRYIYVIYLYVFWRHIWAFMTWIYIYYIYIVCARNNFVEFTEVRRRVIEHRQMLVSIRSTSNDMCRTGRKGDTIQVMSSTALDAGNVLYAVYNVVYITFYVSRAQPSHRKMWHCCRKNKTTGDEEVWWSGKIGHLTIM